MTTGVNPHAIATVAERAQQSEELRKKYRKDVRWHRLVELLFRIDPIGINFETNTDEYDLEATLLMPFIDRRAASVDALTAEIRDVFCWAFGADLSRAGSYRVCAEEIFRANLMHARDETF